MPNERLRAAILERGHTLDAVAQAIGVDEKTVERWITKDRTPYRRHRFAAASFLGVDETFLWPDALSSEQVIQASESELISVYPSRSRVPGDVWGHLFSSARQEIGILVYSGLFLAEDFGIQRILADRARAGVRVRILLGDPDSSQVAERGADEGINDSMAAKVRSVIVIYQPLREIEGIEFRFHRTILYNSIYRADDQLLVNTHVYGIGAMNAPVWHLRKLPGGDMARTYLDSFERVWEKGTSIPEG